jgi:hypothetical protein
MAKRVEIGVNIPQIMSNMAYLKRVSVSKSGEGVTLVSVRLRPPASATRRAVIALENCTRIPELDLDRFSRLWCRNQL